MCFFTLGKETQEQIDANRKEQAIQNCSASHALCTLF